MKQTELQLVQNIIAHMCNLKDDLRELKEEGYSAYLINVDRHLSTDRCNKKDKYLCSKVALSSGIVELAEALGVEYYQEDDEIFFIYEGVCFYQLGEPEKQAVTYKFKKKGE